MRLLNAIGFLTIIKIPSRFYIRQEQYHKTLIFFPAVGFIIGIASSIIFFALNFIFPLILIIIIIAGFEIVISGGIHMDGLADTADGVFSGEKDREKIHAIMKKGDTGVFGVLAILFSISFKVLLYYLIASELKISAFLKSPVEFNFFHYNFGSFLVLITVIIFTPVFGRLVMLYLFSKYEPAVKTGSLAASFKSSQNRPDFIIAAVFTSVIFLAASIIAKINFYFPVDFLKGHPIKSPVYLFYVILATLAATGVIIVLFTIFFASGAAGFFSRRTGGLSGDVIGAVCVLSEVFFLFINYFFIIFFNMLFK
ncbi:MAG: adenosylcobinamide-GDP ribazoletransferase [Actinobacteria bacterium]|nr:adenosylcobinamide-GDP ribazoletransferase [Actinomycetota bacterium]